MRKIDITAEEKKLMINEIKRYFEEERDEEIGDLQGDLILDFFMEQLAPVIYNRGIKDMQAYFTEKIDDMYEHMI